MGVQLDAQHKCDQPYVKAVSQFNSMISERSIKFYLRSDLVWKILGYEREEERLLKILHSFTEKVSLTFIQCYYCV
jgi:hypothetical protein